ncbi:hypothetical protein [Alcaligenes endophyticus]|uniref:Uncharacterized protein n=1 Tax=Alcaligenes endophyticus TaxID=1929088 RepID=A0ABT8EIX0_9BURK|nr:hypothetical protein [Alcaligenes endophyticus]MCX5592515.1 hypothetical protein [Alcaligenes endophyticus]MDN4121241.1 hypothetical protein [Alcaligenes endophyticus]
MSTKPIAEQILEAIKSKSVSMHSREIAELTGLSLNSVKSGIWRLQASGKLFAAGKVAIEGSRAPVMRYSTIKPKGAPAKKVSPVVKSAPETTALLARAAELGQFGILVAQLEVRHGA